MASSVSWILSTLVLAVVLLTSTSNAQGRYQFCDDTAGNFTASSTFQTNLNSLLTSLTSNVTAYDYADGMFGSIPDHVYGLVLCRGDTDEATCKTCLSNAAQDIIDLCPFRKAAVLWLDHCLLRYSNIRIASIIDTGGLCLKNVQIVSSDWPRFNESLMSMFNKLIPYAAYNTSAPPPLLYATADIGFDMDISTIYGMAQCTRDLSNDDCNSCLNTILGELPSCAGQAQGARIIAPSCNVRFEVYDFYNGTSRLLLPTISASSPAPAPALIPPLRPAPPIANLTNSTAQENKKNSSGTILAIVIPVGVALILFTLLCTFCLVRKGSTKRDHRANKQEITATESLLFDLNTVRNATDDFSESNRLGEGGFGAVYQGKLVDGQEIAVKRLSTSSAQGINELKNEVVLLAKLQHRNLVRLLGVCIEEEEKLLIYEYIQNKSLDILLFDPIKKEQLDWVKRFKIIGGIARGMLYLHEESQIKIIHRDLKASNILLDKDMNPKISDFGLARLFDGDQTQANTMRVVGTLGYIAPEYAFRGQFSSKSDVFSFGVLVLEIVTGKRITDVFQSGNSSNLLSYVWEHWSNGTVTDIVDPYLSGNYSQAEAVKCIQIGLLCTQEAATDRPTMSTINLMLNSYSVSAQVPSIPTFLHGYTREPLHQQKNFYLSEGATRSTIMSMPHSKNEVTVTELDPR